MTEASTCIFLLLHDNFHKRRSATTNNQHAESENWSGGLQEMRLCVSSEYCYYRNASNIDVLP